MLDLVFIVGGIIVAIVFGYLIVKAMRTQGEGPTELQSYDAPDYDSWGKSD